MSVKLVMDAIRSSVRRDISFQMIAPPEVAKHYAQIRIKTKRRQDSRSFEIKMQAHYADPSAPFEVQKGQTFTIAPAYTYVDKITYIEVQSYLTKSDLLDMELHRRFPNIVAPDVHIDNREINGVLMAVGNWYWYTWGLINATSYRWIRTERFADRKPSDYMRYQPTLQALKEIPVGVSFGIADRYLFTLPQLLQSNSLFEGVFDEQTGRILITAKADLGKIRFREQMVQATDVAYAKDPVALDEVHEEKWDLLSEPQLLAPQVLTSDDEALILQRTIVFNVTAPEFSSPVLLPMDVKVSPSPAAQERKSLRNMSGDNSGPSEVPDPR